MEFKSISNLEKTIISSVLPNLPRDIYKVYGIPRSGLIPASIISTYLGVALGTIGEEGKDFGERQRWHSKNNGKKILIVDDSIRSGKAMNESKSTMSNRGIEYYTCAIYATPETSELVDFYGEITNKERIFQWNFTGTKVIKDSFWDMDGVICTNPSVFDDDGIKYEKEITHGVKPLFIPQMKIKSIVTNRIEKWRDITTKWLLDNNVQFEKLQMQPFDSAINRRKYSKPYIYKGEIYKNSTAKLFVESDLKQAVKINQISKKPVLSIESMLMIK